MPGEGGTGTAVELVPVVRVRGFKVRADWTPLIKRDDFVLNFFALGMGMKVRSKSDCQCGAE